MASPDPTLATDPIPPPPRRKRRWLRLLAVLVVLLAAALAFAPYAVNLPLVKDRIVARMRDELHAEVQLDRLGFSWFSGIAIDGLRIGNASGFDQSHPFLSLRSLRGDAALAQMLHGRFDLRGSIDGLQLQIDQDRSGRTNAQALFGIDTHAVTLDAGATHGPVLVDHRSDGHDLGRMRFDFQLHDATVVISRDGQVLEELRDLTATMHKEFGGQAVKLDFGAKLTRPSQPQNPGSVTAHADVDLRTTTVDAQLATVGLDLARYQPLASALLAKGDLTALEGVLDGSIKLRLLAAAGGQQLFVDGNMTVDRPKLAGALLRGMTVQAPKWTLSPDLVIAGTAAAPRVTADRFAVDLGCLQLTGLADAEVAAALSGQPGVGCHYTLDVDALTAFGGPIPVWMQRVGGKLAGKLVLPLHGNKLPDLQQVLQQLQADAQLTAKRITVAGFDLQPLDSKLQMKDGEFTLVTGTGTSLNTGPLSLTLKSSLKSLDAVPFELGLGWQDGKVQGEAAQLLRYAVPLLAGLDGKAADFASGVSLALSLKGPALRRPGESWLQLFNQWSGEGNLTLANGTITPAAALQGLLGLLGQEHALAIDKLTGGFTMQKGAVASQLLRWSSKGQEFGLVGSTSLDGKIDYRLDLTAMLAQHKDGQKVLALLGGKALTAGLGGSLDAPRLAPPDLTALLQRAGGGPADELLQKGLDALLGKKKKDQ